jgi:predicted transcriptional regulator
VDLELEHRLYFRDQLRAARAKALEDAEGFQDVLFCLERIGIHLSDKVEGLAEYKGKLADIAANSPLATDVPANASTWHSSFHDLYDELRLARNDAVHQGAYARTLTSHAVELVLILEDAFMSEARKVSQFMVRDPVCARPWQPVSFIRQQMLIHSFSYLPLFGESDRSWRLVPEHSVARYLRSAKDRTERSRRLATPLGKAICSGGLPLLKASTVSPDTELEVAIKSLDEHPILVVNGEGPDSLVGILAASDVL